MAFHKGADEKDKSSTKYLQEQNEKAKSATWQHSRLKKTLTGTSCHLQRPPVPAQPQDPTKSYSWESHHLLWQVTGQASLAISSTALIDDYSIWDRQPHERLTGAL